MGSQVAGLEERHSPQQFPDDPYLATPLMGLLALGIARVPEITLVKYGPCCLDGRRTCEVGSQGRGFGRPLVPFARIRGGTPKVMRWHYTLGGGRRGPSNESPEHGANIPPGAGAIRRERAEGERRRQESAPRLRKMRQFGEGPWAKGARGRQRKGLRAASSARSAKAVPNPAPVASTVAVLCQTRRKRRLNLHASCRIEHRRIKPPAGQNGVARVTGLPPGL